jgi:hypothetical protein
MVVVEAHRENLPFSKYPEEWRPHGRQSLYQWRSQRRSEKELVLFPEVIEWCEREYSYIPVCYYREKSAFRSAGDKGLRRHYYLSFRSHRDAILFMLRWQ